MEKDTSKYLSEARKQMVEQRRLVIRSLGAGHDREQMESHINMMMRIQNAIDVIDRVSREEGAPRDDEVDSRDGRRIPQPSNSS